MKSKDSIFTTHSYQMPPRSRFNIIPVGDVHFRSPGHDADRFDSFLDDCRKTNDDNWYVWMGDEHDTASYTEREILNNPKIHDSTISVFDLNALESCLELYEKCEFMAGRVIGMIQGNHYWRFSGDIEEHGITEGTTSTEFMCKLFKCKWLGFLSYVRVHGQHSQTHQAKWAVDMLACHGKAGGKMVGTSINQVDDMRRIFPVADLYLQGHNHSRSATPDSCLTMPQNDPTKIKQKRQWLCRTGSFLGGYTQGKESYIVKKLLRPSELGSIKIEVKILRDVKDGRDNIINDIHVWS